MFPGRKSVATAFPKQYSPGPALDAFPDKLCVEFTKLCALVFRIPFKIPAALDSRPRWAKMQPFNTYDKLAAPT